MQWIIDRIEEDTAIVEIEDGTFINVPLKALPENVNEGDVVAVKLDPDGLAARKKKVGALMDKLFAD